MTRKARKLTEKTATYLVEIEYEMDKVRTLYLDAEWARGNAEAAFIDLLTGSEIYATCYQKVSGYWEFLTGYDGG